MSSQNILCYAKQYQLCVPLPGRAQEYPQRDGGIGYDDYACMQPVEKDYLLVMAETMDPPRGEGPMGPTEAWLLGRSLGQERREMGDGDRWG